MNSLRVALCGAALALLAAASPAEATTTVASGDYSSGSFIISGGDFSVGPGTYQISLAFTEPVDDFNGWVKKLFNSQYFCDFGDGEFACDGDSGFVAPEFQMISPELYQLMLTVNGPSSLFGAPGDPIVREDRYDTCCTYGFRFEGGNAGHFTLSYNAVPEPATWAMMLLGFGAIGFAARRRRQQTRLLATS